MVRIPIGAGSVAVVALLSAMAMPAFGDKIDPSSYTYTLAPGGEVTITKTVTVSTMATAPVDVFFLMDTTGSMGGALSSVTAGFAGIVSSVSALSADTYFGIGNYNDCRDGVGDCPPGTLGQAYTQNQDLTNSTSAVQSALGSLFANGGGDNYESNLYALRQVADTTSWRTDSRRFLFWAGDFPGHDPRQGVTEPIATAALVAANVKTYALNVGYGMLDGTGQATRITAATGGSVLSGGYSEASTLIQAALTSSLSNYGSVALEVFGLSPGLSVSFLPAAYTGAYNRGADRDFTFDVSFAGTAPGTYDFEIRALVDGSIVARETDSITVTGIPEPSTLVLFGGAFLVLLSVKRRLSR